jgi:hypothetical protein
LCFLTEALSSTFRCLPWGCTISLIWPHDVCYPSYQPHLKHLSTIRGALAQSVWRLTLDDRRVKVQVPIRSRIFIYSISSRLALGPTQPPVLWVQETLSAGIKRKGREADHLAPTIAEVKKAWIYTSTPPYIFMA